MADWSKLPNELLLLIAFRLFSVLELLRFRSVCTSWRSSVSVADVTPFPMPPLILPRPLVPTFAATEEGRNREVYPLDRGLYLSPVSYFRISHHSSSDKGWLIKYAAGRLSYGEIYLHNPLADRLFRNMSKQTIDLLQYNVSEIRPAYAMLKQRPRESISLNIGFNKVVLGGNHQVIGINYRGIIKYWNGVVWSMIKNQYSKFCDIIVHKGLTYALDIEGMVWWVSSTRGVFRYGPTFCENVTECCWRDRRLVECRGVFYIVVRFLENRTRKRKACELHPNVGNSKRLGSDPETVGFMVYKRDEELCEWVQVDSLGDNAFVMAYDSCFSVLAHEFYGCLKNSIYFTEEIGYNNNKFKVFRLDDGSIETMSEESLSCFQMLIPSF